MLGRVVGFGALLALSVFSVPAQAADLYFDVWCQEQGYDRARCESRNPGDVAAFEQYWRTVERYEESYRWTRNENRRFKDNLNYLDQALPPGIPN